MIAVTIVHVPYWWHASLLEVLWLIGGVIALAITALNLHDAVKDTVILDDIRNDPTVHERHYRMIVLAARGRTADQALTFGKAALIVLAGVIGIITPNPTGGATTITGFAVTAVLDGVAVLTAARALAAMKTRQRMYELAAGRARVLAAQMLVDERRRQLGDDP